MQAEFGIFMWLREIVIFMKFFLINPSILKYVQKI